MRSTAEIIFKELAGLAVLDLGGVGYGESNPYEKEVREAWSRTKQRTIVDCPSRADCRINLNQPPLPELNGRQWDITVAFDVLEQLNHPLEVLRWIPTERLIVKVPNALSLLARQREIKRRFGHLFSFTPYTASVLLRQAGWHVERVYFSFGDGSFLCRMINLFGSRFPSYIGTGIVFHCTRVSDESSTCANCIILEVDSFVPGPTSLSEGRLVHAS
ncbi:MAG: hypothetical protein V1929_06590 [bacterium]